jgi:hypothetical protein
MTRVRCAFVLLLSLAVSPLYARQGTALGLTAQVSGNTVSFAWQGDATSWVLEAGSGPGLSNLAVFPFSSPSPAYTVPNVPPGTYFVRIRGVLFGSAGAPSNEVIVQVGGAPAPSPQPCQVGELDLRSTRTLQTLTLNWNQIGLVDTVQLEAGTAPGLSNIAIAQLPRFPAQFTATGPPGVYWIRLRPFRSCGVGAPSNEVAVELSTVPLPTCTPTLSPFNRNVLASGIYTVTVSVPAGCTWTAFTREGWISVLTPSGNGPGTIQYRVTLPGGGTGQIYVTTLAGRYSVNVTT